ncbi:MAG: DUF2845 domain-containing protein [Pseudomonadales bacterium]|nr:DUF2845 domain-containing protein [Pseudomonadales bacterium]
MMTSRPAPKKWMTLVLTCLLMGPALAHAAIRCGTSLVDLGDWPVEVRDRCGEPDYVAVYPTRAVPGLGVTQTVEHWYYNPGPHRLIRRLEFRNGRLQRVKTLGYGFYPDPHARCDSRALREGLSEFELVSRCGEPVSERLFWQPFDLSSLADPVPGISIMPVKEWLYGFGKHRFRRIVILRDGLVVEVRTGNKPR